MYTIHVVIIISALMPGLLRGSLLPLKQPKNSPRTRRSWRELSPDWLASDDVTMTSFNSQGQSGDRKQRSGSVHLRDGHGSEMERWVGALGI